MATYNTLIGNEVESLTLPRTQVYKATHDGSDRLPFMQRSFISFTYGGKHIEDFNLIAVNSGDRMEREGYASFEDLTSTYDTIHGQFYWGTYFHENSLNLTLATDGITQNQLDDFKRWFRAGSIRELILAEHPNRAILARIAQPPHISVIPFQETVTVPFYNEFGDKTYTTSTTLYRGQIDLEFVMDEPFWYSIQNILGRQNTLEGYYEENWIDANGRIAAIADSPDALKIIYEDRIPLGSTTAIDVFLGGDTYASVSYTLWSKIVTAATETEWNAAQQLNLSDEKMSYSRELETHEVEEEDENGNKQTIQKQEYTYYKGAHIATEIDGELYGARIGGSQIEDVGEVQGVALPYGSEANLYYAGTAPSPVKLRFTLQPTFSSDYYIITPGNSHSDGNAYNTITLTSTEKHEFKFTLPTFWLSYNQVLEIFDNDSIMKVGTAWLTVRETIRNTIRHPIIRAWANMLINKYDSSGGNGIITQENQSMGALRGDLKQGMQYLLLDSSRQAFPAAFTFDGKTGLAIGKFLYRDIDLIEITPNESLVSQIQAGAIEKTEVVTTDPESGETITTVTEKQKENYFKTQEENVGDMVRSSYLILDERNVLDGYYRVQNWSEEHPDYAYLITHDVVSGLQDLHFEFKNLYL